ncbi:MAG: InlB B-repeat-containing protein, partial [Clostridia bacterium]|nr:InlB B-repeat-containing protein [Clostridia bacterium]
ELNNGEEAIEVEVNDGIVEIPEAPKKDGFKFDGWYADTELTEKWDFLTSEADEDTVLYAKWEELPDDSLYTISVSTNLGGVITVKPTKAKAGEVVTITVKTDEGKKLVENSLSVNGKFIDEYTFVMPANNVIVEAQFENVNADEVDADKNELKDNMGKFVTIGAIAIVVIAIIIWLIVNRYRFLPEEEEDELFFVEPMTNQPAIRHDDFVRNKLNQMNSHTQSDDIDIMNEAEIRKINKTGNINLDQ